jgi:hypothetical protein
MLNGTGASGGEPKSGVYDGIYHYIFERLKCIFKFEKIKRYKGKMAVRSIQNSVFPVHLFSIS